MNPKHLTHQISTSYVCEMQVSNPKHKVYYVLKETAPSHELLMSQACETKNPKRSAHKETKP